MLELVKTTLINLSEQAHAAQAILGEHEVRFAVDDFGTGYYWLARVKDLPAQVLETDPGFIAHIAYRPGRPRHRPSGDHHGSGPRSHMHRRVGETAAQRDALRALAVNAYQGRCCSPAPC